MKVLSSFLRLKSYCESQNFAGWDPYDGLNSKVFQTIPFLKQSALCRLVVIQGFKRSPVNLRPLALVSKEHNAKGIALFLSGYCNLYHAIQKGTDMEISKEDCLDKIHYLARLLLSLKSKGYSGACWGYNFDWQGRRIFLFPKNTPTVVATSFAVSALSEAYEITHEKVYLKEALSAADFVMNDLHRIECGNGFLFSYSPLPGNDTVFNASLLGSKILSICYHYTKKEEYKLLAAKTIEACCEAQNKDGSWIYGKSPTQGWIDSFHTGYNLEAIQTFQNLTGDHSFEENIIRGFDFYISNFFLDDGIPKYYHDRIYPIDIHCPGQLFVVLSKLNRFNEWEELAEKVMSWTLENMQDKKGYFYYQIKPRFSSKISYMRWSNAFMFNTMSFYIKSITVIN